MWKHSWFLLVAAGWLLYSWQLAVLLAAGALFVLSLASDRGMLGEGSGGHPKSEQGRVERQLDSLIHDTGLLYREVHAWRTAFEEKAEREERRRLRSKDGDIADPG